TFSSGAMATWSATQTGGSQRSKPSDMRPGVSTPIRLHPDHGMVNFAARAQDAMTDYPNLREAREATLLFEHATAKSLTVARDYRLHGLGISGRSNRAL